MRRVSCASTRRSSIARVSSSARVDRLARDLVEDHAAHRDLRLQHLEQVPGDRLALAILVCREQELVGVLQLLAQVGDHVLLVRVDDVVRREVVLDVDGHPSPRLALDLGGISAALVGRSRMWPMLDSTTYPSPR